MKILENKY